MLKKAHIKASIFICLILNTVFTSIIFAQNAKLDLNIIREDSVYIDFLNKEAKNLGRSFPDSALELAKKAEKITIKIANYSGLIETYNVLGNIYKNQSNYELALFNHHKSYILSEYLKNDKAKSRSLNNIGIIHFLEKNYDKALEYYISSEKIKKRIGDKRGLSFCYNNISSIYDISKEYDIAISFAEKALEIKKEFNDSLGISFSYQYLGRIHMHSKEYDIAEEYLLNALYLKKRINDIYGTSQAFYNLAILYSNKAAYENDIYNKRKYSKKSIEYAHQSLDLSKRLNAINNQRIAYKILYEEYLARAEFTQALNYQSKYYKLTDSLFNIDKINQIHNLETKYQDQKKRITINNLKKENILKERNIKTLNTLILLSAILSLMFVLFIIMLMVFRIKLKRRNHVITSQLQEISQQNESLFEYQNHLELMIKEQTADITNAKEIAEKADMLKTAFLENLSHEIRTPLNAIVGFSHLLKSSEKKENNDSYIDNILNSSDSLLKIIDSVMQVSKIQTGDFELEYSVFLVQDLLEKIYLEFSNSKTYINEKKIDIRLVTNKNINDLEIFSDITSLETILYNLTDNALKYTDAGYIEIGAKLSGDDKILFHVKDTGIGISKENIGHIFDKFRKVDPENSKLYRGMGLGLNIVKSLVKKINGTIWVESEKNFGTSFYLTIPINESFINSEFTEKVNIEKGLQLNLINKKILIAEDQKINLELLNTIISETKASTFTVSNGKEAVETFTKNPEIDLIFLDIKMPVMNGMDACKKIRKSKIGKKIKIIALTGYAKDYNEGIFLKSGFDDHIEKPVDIDDIYKTLKKYLT